MKISVCMATFNGGEYIREQIESILSQLSQNDELIVSDDGSYDNTIEVVKGINDARIKVVLNHGVKGYIHNFENALTVATGDYIFLSDQDDVWLPGRVDNACEYLLDNVLVVSDASIVDSNLCPLFSSFFLYRDVKPGLLNNIVKIRYWGYTMAFQKKVLDTALPFPPFAAHDVIIGLTSEFLGNVFFDTRKQILYRRHDKAVSMLGKKGFSRIPKQILSRVKLVICICLLYHRVIKNRKRGLYD